MLRLLLCAIVGSGSTAVGQPRPKLGVLIVIDQLSSDTFEARVAKTTGGIRRLVDQGARFRDTRYEAAPTVTSAGHATIVTGAYASVHGVVANEWIDWKTGKGVLSTEDVAYQTLGRPPAKHDGTAPTNLRVPTLGDSMKVRDPRAKVVTISGKDRSAILLAGRSADAAVWFDSERPHFTSSTFYGAKLPAFVAPVNQLLGVALQKGVFEWGPPPGEATGAKSVLRGRQGDSEPDAEQPALQPLVDAWEVDLAIAAVKALQLGADDAPDLLAVSFSGHDRIGHTFGPDAPEALAEFLTVDRELGRLLDALDAMIGKGNWAAMLTSDHGVAPSPELMKQRRIDAGRIDMKGLRAKLEQEADARLGPGDWFAGSKTPGISATPQGREKLTSIAASLRAVALEQPGVLEFLPGAQLTAGALGPDHDAWRRGYVPGRSPDFIVVAKPYWLYSLTDVAGHASQWLYDRSVPLIFFGPNVARGVFEHAEIVDAAPTFARMLSVPAPAGARGRVLSNVFVADAESTGRNP